jgi:hypothetical protein
VPEFRTVIEVCLLVLGVVLCLQLITLVGIFSEIEQELIAFRRKGFAKQLAASIALAKPDPSDDPP